MIRRIFLVLWFAWALFILLPVSAMSVHDRWTNGFDIIHLLSFAAAIWIPCLVLLGIQYIFVGHANVRRLWFDE